MSVRTVHRAVVALGAASVLLCSASPASAVIDWTDWQAATEDFPSSVSAGTLTSAIINVSYNGSSLFTQFGAGPDYWSPSTPYISGSVPNAPTPAEMVAVTDFASTHTISFGGPVTNPVMAIVGLGSSSTLTQWDFDAPFSLLSSGVGFFGGAGTLIQPLAASLQGDDGSGVIRFTGTFTSISWVITNGEQPWTDENLITGITVGIEIPTPGAAAIMIPCAALSVRRRRRA
jgi:hypothetical protein